MVENSVNEWGSIPNVSNQLPSAFSKVSCHNVYFILRALKNELGTIPKDLADKHLHVSLCQRCDGIAPLLQETPGSAVVFTPRSRMAREVFVPGLFWLLLGTPSVTLTPVSNISGTGRWIDLGVLQDIIISYNRLPTGFWASALNPSQHNWLSGTFKPQALLCHFLLETLLWLPIFQRIKAKVLNMGYKNSSPTLPFYSLFTLFHPCTSLGHSSITLSMSPFRVGGGAFAFVPF